MGLLTKLLRRTPELYDFPHLCPSHEAGSNWGCEQPPGHDGPHIASRIRLCATDPGTGAHDIHRWT